MDRFYDLNNNGLGPERNILYVLVEIRDILAEILARINEVSTEIEEVDD